MSVIIRLQNLPWSANALDIRQFFRGLNIPEGGVHIVGGENGDAFIAFSTDEDARQAMRLDGGKIKEVQVHLLLSSRAEMQKVIETARQTTMQYVSLTTPTSAPIVNTQSVTHHQSQQIQQLQHSQQQLQQQKQQLQQLQQQHQQLQQLSQSHLATNNSALSATGIKSLTAAGSLQSLHHQKQLIAAQSNAPASSHGNQILSPTQGVVKPQPPVITSNSLSGILAHQMFQQQQMQMMSQQQNMPLMTSTSVRHDNYNTQTKPYLSSGAMVVTSVTPVVPAMNVNLPINNKQPSIDTRNLATEQQPTKENVNPKQRSGLIDPYEKRRDDDYSGGGGSGSGSGSGVGGGSVAGSCVGGGVGGNNGKMRQLSRSRSKSRERRDRRRSRSRERRTGRYRDRSRSRDRRHKRRNRSRSRSRNRDRNRTGSRTHSFEKDDRDNAAGRHFDSIKSPDTGSYKGSMSQNENSDCEKKQQNMGKQWDNGQLSMMGDNQASGVGIMQNFSSPGNQMGGMMMDSHGTINKPISLFTNMYNQPEHGIANHSMNNNNGNNFSPNMGTNFDNNKRNDFDSMMPGMMSYGNMVGNDQSMSGNRSSFGMMSSSSPSPSTMMFRQKDNGAAPSMQDNGQFYCLRIKNIGNDTHYSTLRRFFCGFHIPNDGVKLINDQYGNRIGEAIIRFLRPEVAKAAMAAKNGTMINGQNMVHIKMATLNDYDSEVDSYRPPRNAGGGGGGFMGGGGGGGGGGFGNGFSSYGGNDRNRGGGGGGNRDQQGFRNNGGRSYNDNDDDYRRSSNNRGRYNNDRDRSRNDNDDYRRGDRNDQRNNNNNGGGGGGGSSINMKPRDDHRSNHRNRDNFKFISTTLLIEGLPSSDITEEEIRQIFSKFTVQQVILPCMIDDLNAYVKLSSNDEAQTAANEAYRIGYKPIFVSICSEERYDRFAKQAGLTQISLSKASIKSGIEKNELKTTAGSTRSIIEIDDDDDDGDGDGDGDDDEEADNDKINEDIENNDDDNEIDQGDGIVENDDGMDICDDDLDNDHPKSDTQDDSNTQDNDNSSSSVNKSLKNSDENVKSKIDQEKRLDDSTTTPAATSSNTTTTTTTATTSSDDSVNSATKSGIPSLIDMNFNKPNAPPNFLQGLPNINSSDPRLKQRGGNFNYLNSYSTPASDSSDNKKDLNSSSNSNDEERSMGSGNDRYSQHSKTNYRNQQQHCDDSEYISVTNMEYKTTEKDIMDWFGQINLMPKHVYLLKNTRGLPSGNCFCKFNSRHDAQNSLIKHRSRFGLRTVFLHLVPKERVLKEIPFMEDSDQDDDDDDDDNDNDNGEDSSNRYSSNNDESNRHRNKNNDDDDDHDDNDDNNDNAADKNDRIIDQDDQSDNCRFDNERNVDEQRNIDTNENDNDDNDDNDNDNYNDDDKSNEKNSRNSNRNNVNADREHDNTNNTVNDDNSYGGGGQRNRNKDRQTNTSQGHRNPFRQDRNKDDMDYGGGGGGSRNYGGNSGGSGGGGFDGSGNFGSGGGGCGGVGSNDQCMDMSMNRNQFMPSMNNMMTQSMRGDNTMNNFRSQGMMNYGNHGGGDRNNNKNNGGGGNGGGGGGGGGYGNMNNGCIIELRNVPYKATITDILQLFHGFPVSSNNVIRRYNDDGSPTGDARICFNSPMQARMAIERNRNGRIMGRTIYFSVLS